MAADDPQALNANSAAPDSSAESESGYSGEALDLYRAEFSRQYAKLASLHPDKSADELQVESHEAAVRLTDLKIDKL